MAVMTLIAELEKRLRLMKRLHHACMQGCKVVAGQHGDEPPLPSWHCNISYLIRRTRSADLADARDLETKCVQARAQQRLKGFQLWHQAMA